VTSYAPQYRDAISLEAGEIVHVGPEDTDYRDWYWCRGPRGDEGWVHRLFLSGTSGTATTLQRYSARDLATGGGARGVLSQLLDGWAYVRLDNGDEDWLPADHIRTLRFRE
jgi:SH3-like domain-containing protein